jgi:hypothetical protein
MKNAPDRRFWVDAGPSAVGYPNGKPDIQPSAGPGRRRNGQLSIDLWQEADAAFRQGRAALFGTDAASCRSLLVACA